MSAIVIDRSAIEQLRRLREQVAKLTEERDRLRSENAHLRARVNGYEIDERLARECD